MCMPCSTRLKNGLTCSGFIQTLPQDVFESAVLWSGEMKSRVHTPILFLPHLFIS